MQNSQENTCVREKRLWQRCFPVNFANFLRKRFSQNTYERLLLSLIYFYNLFFLLQISVWHVFHTFEHIEQNISVDRLSYLWIGSRYQKQTIVLVLLTTSSRFLSVFFHKFCKNNYFTKHLFGICLSFWTCEGSEDASSSEYDRVLNIPGFEYASGSEYARVWMSGLHRVLNMPE